MISDLPSVSSASLRFGFQIADVMMCGYEDCGFLTTPQHLNKSTPQHPESYRDNKSTRQGEGKFLIPIDGLAPFPFGA